MERLSAFDWLPRPVNCVFPFLVTGVIKITCQRWSPPFERINCVILIFSIDSEIKQVLTLLFCFGFLLPLNSNYANVKLSRNIYYCYWIIHIYCVYFFCTYETVFQQMLSILKNILI